MTHKNLVQLRSQRVKRRLKWHLVQIREAQLIQESMRILKYSQFSPTGEVNLGVQQFPRDDELSEK